MKKMLRRIAALACIMSLTCATTSSFASTTMYCEKCNTATQWSTSCEFDQGRGAYNSFRSHYYNDINYGKVTCEYIVGYFVYQYTCNCGNVRWGSVHPCREGAHAVCGAANVAYH